MQLADLFTLSSDRLGDSSEYLQPAFRSYFFVANTILLALSTGIDVVVFIRCWKLLPPFVGAWMGVSLVATYFLWARALKGHRRLRRLCAENAITEFRSGSPVEVSLRTSATIANLAMCYLPLVNGGLAMSIGMILLGR